jgi:hypothetical protein
LYVAQVLPPGFVTPGVFTVRIGLDSELMGQKGNHVGGRDFLTAENPAGEFQIRKMHRKPQSIGITPSLTDQR